MLKSQIPIANTRGHDRQAQVCPGPQGLLRVHVELGSEAAKALSERLQKKEEMPKKADKWFNMADKCDP